MKTLDFPLSKITLCFIAGLLLAYFTATTPSVAFGLLTGSFLAAFLCYFFSGRHFLQKSYFGLAVGIMSVATGTAAYVFHNDYFQKSHYIHRCTHPEATYTIEVRLEEKLKSTAYKQRYVCTVKSVNGHHSSGKILLNIQRDSLTYDPETGSNLRISGKINRHSAPANPGQFDYGRYLSQKSIYAQIDAEKSSITANGTVDKSIAHYASKFRNRILDNLRGSSFKKAELNTVAALILGQQQEIPKEILQDYQYAGAIHVLSVSGLHVGFILLFVNFLLSWLPKNTWGRGIRFTAVFISLWTFAIIAGLAPSIVRSVTMFTFMAFGMCLKRETNIFHSLLASILFILILSPSFLFDAGFQLSYISLFFILWLQPLLAGIWKPENKIKSYFWNVLTVSFAAQIGTLPVSLYYFHQFPGLFFLTNLIILPGLGIIMGLGCFVMAAAAFGYTPGLPIIVLESLTAALNATINRIASFEQFIIRDIPMSLFLMLALYLFLSCVVLWIEKPGFKRISCTLLSVLLLQICCIATKWNIGHHNEVVVFHIPKHTAVIKRTGTCSVLYADEHILSHPEKYNLIASYLIENFNSKTSKGRLKNIYSFGDKKILVIDSSGIYPKADPDILIVTQSPKINLARILLSCSPEMVIADGSNYKTYVSRWGKTCRKHKIPFHATHEKGFYKLD